MGLKSHLYRCRVMHHRLSPTRYRFTHDGFLFYLDLDELDTLDKTSAWLGINRHALYRFDEADHLPTSQAALQTSLKTRVWTFLADHGITDEPGPVWLLTNLRVLGYVFNPVSFYFCFNLSGQPVAAIAEVGNTFGEMKPFFIPLKIPPETGGIAFGATPEKAFYVSPFGKLDHRFDFRLVLPDDNLDLAIDTLSPEGPVIKTTLTGHPIGLTTANLLKMTFMFPWITLQVIGWIHWHAFCLWLKRTPFYRKEAWPQRQVGVLNPHRSLTSTPVILSPDAEGSHHGA